ncbi:MAG: hypothetical protein V4550_11570 [Gemmatimonadota bacterium]
MVHSIAEQMQERTLDQAVECTLAIAALMHNVPIAQQSQLMAGHRRRSAYECSQIAHAQLGTH